MSYEDLVRRAIHLALVDLVRDHSSDGIDGVELAKDGGLLKIRGEAAFAVHFGRVEPEVTK